MHNFLAFFVINVSFYRIWAVLKKEDIYMKFAKKDLVAFPLSFALGSFIYPMIEIAFRGYTHYSMALAGGFGLFMIYLTRRVLPSRSVYLHAFIGALIITVTEFMTGVIFNIFLGARVWDYSELPFNILGQVSLVFSLAWYLLALGCVFVCMAIERLSDKTVDGSYRI